jgi:hypothetical protein
MWRLVMRQNSSTMKFARRRWLVTIGLSAAIVWGAACSNKDQEEAERKAREAAARAGAAAEKASEQAAAAAKDAAAKAKEAAKEFGSEARDAALKGASAAAKAGSEAAVVAGDAAQVAGVKAAGLLRTGAIKAALLANTDLDVSGVDIDTDEARKIVVLKGRARSAAEKATIAKIAAEKAPGYRIENQLAVR